MLRGAGGAVEGAGGQRTCCGVQRVLWDAECHGERVLRDAGGAGCQAGRVQVVQGVLGWQNAGCRGAGVQGV